MYSIHMYITISADLSRASSVLDSTSLPTASQPASKAARQQGSKAARQQGSKAARQPGSGS